MQLNKNFLNLTLPDKPKNPSPNPAGGHLNLAQPSAVFLNLF